MFTDNIIAALIGLGGAMFTGLVGWYSGRVLKHEGVAERNLGVQFQGWKDYTDALTRDISELGKRLDECERDRAEMWKQIRLQGGAP